VRRQHGPLAARAQQPVIGYFSGRSADTEAPLLVSFRHGLEEANYTVERNVAVEFRFSEGQDDLLCNDIGCAWFIADSPQMH
jgi:hypothetical protein